MKRFFVVILAIAPLFFNNASSKTEWIALEDVRKLIVPGVHFGGSDPKIDGTYRIPQFRCQFKTEGKIRRANARVCGLGHFEFMLNGEKVGDHFLDPGWTCYDKEALYVGCGKQNVEFRSNDASNPAKFYINSAPAYKPFVTQLITTDKAKYEKNKKRYALAISEKALSALGASVVREG